MPMKRKNVAENLVKPYFFTQITPKYTKIRHFHIPYGIPPTQPVILRGGKHVFRMDGTMFSEPYIIKMMHLVCVPQRYNPTTAVVKCLGKIFQW